MAESIDHIFIDTCVFIKHNFGESPAIKTFFDAAKKGVITILMPELTKYEIDKHLAKEIADKPLSNPIHKISSNSIFKRFNKSLIEQLEDASKNLLKTAQTQLDKDLKDAKVVMLPMTNDIDIVKIVEKYTKHKKPFSVKKEKEFPDAIVLETLETWCKKKGRKCILLSTDSDLADYESDNLVFTDFETYKAELMKVVKKFDDEEKLKKDIIAQLEQDPDVENSITELVNEGFDDEVLYCSQLQVEEVNDYMFNLEYIEFDSLSLKRDGIFEDYVAYKIFADICVSAKVTHPNYETAYYDNEDHRWMFIDEDVTESLSYRLTIPVSFTTDADGKDIILESINNGRYLSRKTIEDAYDGAHHEY